MISINLRKQVGSGEQAFNIQVNTTLETGQIIALFGPSGVGKTTILRLLAGLMKADEGKIEMDGISWYDSENKIFKAPQKREVGLVFQESSLFPNMSVLENLNYASSGKKDVEHIQELIELTEIKSFLDRKPDSLSGGEKQRVALARAMVRKPKLLLLDEPLSALDYSMRKRLQDQIVSLHKRFGLTTLLVSHDLGEIYRLADQIMIMENGQIRAVGNPIEIFGHKKLSGKFQFTGQILSIELQDIIYVVTILIGNQIIQVAADPSEVKDLKEGDKVLVASKAFNPVIHKVGT
jgi:molybdate transport system ATP-binding protein